MGLPLTAQVRSDGQDATHHATIVPAPVAPDLRAGSRLAGYQLDAIVGRGGMGVVYRAQHLHLGRTVALKVLGPDLAANERFRERFLRESRIAASIDHPNVVTVYDAGEGDGLLFIAMQYVDGTDLAAVLRQEGGLVPERALIVLGQVAEALDAAHALGLVHRDVKPANVLIDEKRCYLTDFGLTRRLSSDTALTSKGEFVGTIDYMPPEQIEGGILDARSDVYALGCLLCHVLTGQVPYDKDSEVSVIYAHMQEPPPSVVARRPGLSTELDSVIAKSMAKRREDRFASATELIAAARAATGVEAAPPGSAAALASLPLRSKVLVAADDRTVRALVHASLDEQRFLVLEAVDGPAAIEIARRERPDLIVADWMLPETVPADLARILRADASSAKLVAVTARADVVDDRAALAAGFDGHIRKPFSSMQLLYKVGELLGAEVLA